jgi:hypothetical protein
MLCDVVQPSCKLLAAGCAAAGGDGAHGGTEGLVLETTMSLDARRGATRHRETGPGLCPNRLAVAARGRREERRSTSMVEEE